MRSVNSDNKMYKKLDRKTFSIGSDFETWYHPLLSLAPHIYSIVIAPTPSPKKGFVKREALAQITLSPNNSTYCHFLLALNNAFSSSMLSKKIGMSIEHLLLSMTFSQTKSRSCKLKTRLLQALGL